MYTIRPCRKDETSVICEIINSAAEAYRGIIPADQQTALLETYWSIPLRQIETSVVLANPPLASTRLSGERL